MRKARKPVSIERTTLVPNPDAQRIIPERSWNSTSPHYRIGSPADGTAKLVALAPEGSDDKFSIMPVTVVHDDEYEAALRSANA